jgi:uncharacterized protein (TIGR02646 family)
MRFVDIAVLQLPPGWFARAQTASAAVANGDSPNDHAGIWRELKDGLADLLFSKCWYCETPIERSDNAVDHFRPKGRVSDAAHPHAGYRWLAFDQHNFRYSCTFCNSRRKDVETGTAGGKADRFPLLVEDNRLYAHGPLTQEQPMLLDPCVVTDCQLLGCQREDGKPCPSSNDPTDKRRAEESIEILHLHYEPTCKRRHTEAVKLFADIEDGKRRFVDASRDIARKAEFQEVAKRLIRMIKPNAPFSGDMRFLMRGERSEDHPWIQELLEA